MSDLNDINDKVQRGESVSGADRAALDSHISGKSGGGGFSVKNGEAFEAGLKVIGPILLGTVAAYGILAPFKGMLQDFHLIYVSKWHLLIPSVIAAFFLNHFVFKSFLRGEITIKNVLPIAVLIPCLLNGGTSLFVSMDIIGNNLDRRLWRDTFYSYRNAQVNADEAVLRAAPAADAEAVLTLERGKDFGVWGDAGEGWYFAQAGSGNYGYMRADSLTIKNTAKLKPMRPIAVIVDNASIHRRRSWRSWQRAAANKDEYVLAVGKSRGGWTPVFNAGANGWAVGYINDALLFFAGSAGGGAAGVQAPAEPKGIETNWDSADTALLDSNNKRYMYAVVNTPGMLDAIFESGNQRYLYDRLDGSGRYNYKIPEETIPKGGRIILLEKWTDKRMIPFVYNGRMGWLF
jgi:hypothetical protein